VKTHQEDARQADAWERILAEKLDPTTPSGKYFLTAGGRSQKLTRTDATELLDLKPAYQNRSTETLLGNVFQALGFTHKRERTGARRYYYVREVKRPQSKAPRQQGTSAKSGSKRVDGPYPRLRVRPKPNTSAMSRKLAVTN
jgi:hypothetical protein